MKIIKKFLFQHCNWRSTDHVFHGLVSVITPTYLFLVLLDDLQLLLFQQEVACTSHEHHRFSVYLFISVVFSVSWSLWQSKCLFGVILNIRKSICFIPVLGYKIVLVKNPSRLGAAGLGAAFRQWCSPKHGDALKFPCSALLVFSLNKYENCHGIKGAIGDEIQKAFFNAAPANW